VTKTEMFSGLASRGFVYIGYDEYSVRSVDTWCRIEVGSDVRYVLEVNRARPGYVDVRVVCEDILTGKRLGRSVYFSDAAALLAWVDA